MDTGLAGYLGARAALHVATARGQEAELAPIPPRPKEANHALAVVRILGFVMCVVVQVMLELRQMYACKV